MSENIGPVRSPADKDWNSC